MMLKIIQQICVTLRFKHEASVADTFFFLLVQGYHVTTHPKTCIHLESFTNVFELYIRI